MKPRVFLLSPARAGGVRMQMLLRLSATFPLALKVQRGEATLGEAFEFASGLYFRGKRTYARTFAEGDLEVMVIAPGVGLLPVETPITPEQLRALGSVEIDETDEAFRGPLVRAARALDDALGTGGEAILLGSIASQKYVVPLLEVFGERLLFPTDFVGRGDMSRGGLLLRAARENTELTYSKVHGAQRHGTRPPRLTRLPRNR